MTQHPVYEGVWNMSVPLVAEVTVQLVRDDEWRNSVRGDATALANNLDATLRHSATLARELKLRKRQEEAERLTAKVTRLQEEASAVDAQTRPAVVEKLRKRLTAVQQRATAAKEEFDEYGADLANPNRFRPEVLVGKAVTHIPQLLFEFLPSENEYTILDYSAVLGTDHWSGPSPAAINYPLQSPAPVPHTPPTTSTVLPHRATGTRTRATFHLTVLDEVTVVDPEDEIIDVLREIRDRLP